MQQTKTTSPTTSPLPFPPKEEMRMHYGKSRIYGDFIRSFLGITLAVIGLWFLQALWWVDMIFAIIGTLFGLYLWQTFSRTLRPVVVSGDAISLGDKAIAWGDIERIKLRHYGGHKYSVALGSGFFELSVSTKDAKITCDSGITEFNKLLGLLQSARDNYDIAIDDSSMHNLLHLTKGE